MTKRRVRTRTHRSTLHNVVTAENDNLSAALSDLVPKQYHGTDLFLDVIQWNLEWFGARKSVAKDEQRLDVVLDVLEALNGDLFIFQEVAGPSWDKRYPGALDDVAAELTRRGAGDYVVYYTEAGGEQRVAMMWDRDWLRAKTDARELFPRGTHLTEDGKDAFGGRTPLYACFEARSAAEAPATGHGGSAHRRFDFQALGVHLKAMEDGAPQRLASARVLANWLTKDSPRVDSDAMIMGDWNAPPADKCWEPFHKLDHGSEARLAFRSINDPSKFSYLWLQNRTTKYVSRIDLTAMSLSSLEEVKGTAAEVVRWRPIQETLARAGELTDRQVQQVMLELKEQISDHLPVVTRFYFEEPAR
jgi:endonuclease/exonuclease/phosphatase family metal-dependent hydrolase